MRRFWYGKENEKATKKTGWDRPSETQSIDNQEKREVRTLMKWPSLPDKEKMFLVYLSWCYLLVVLHLLNTDGSEHQWNPESKMLTIAIRASVLWLICYFSIMKSSLPLSGLVLICVLVNIAANRQDEARFFGWLVVSSTSTPDSSPEDPCEALTSFSFVLFSFTNRIAEAPTVDFREWLSW